MSQRTSRPELTRDAEARYLAAGALFEAGLTVQAEAGFKGVVAAAPRHAPSWNMLGVIATMAGQPGLAARRFREAVKLHPSAADYHWNLGAALLEAGESRTAVDAFRRALRHDPENADLHGKLGNVFLRLDRPEEAIASLRRSLALDARQSDIHHALSVTLLRTGRPEEALAATMEHARVLPGVPDAHFHRALTLLLLGRFSEGWPLYEIRLKLGAASEINRRAAAIPAWTGEPIPGGTLLLFAEQGMGDAIQFCRYAALAKLRSGAETVVVEVHKPLVRLLECLAGTTQGIRIVAHGAEMPLPDRQRALLSLPLVFHTELATIPAAIPYLFAQPKATAAWRDRLAGSPGLKVGIVWSGSRQFSADETRSMPPGLLLPLTRVAGVRLVSLQVGEAAGDIAAFPAGSVLDPTKELTDFADTAALVAALDLVISVDTAVAHLAGALGKQVWLMNRIDGDWRWLLNRDDSPWYPTLRQFRQHRPGDWAGVVRRVADALAVSARGVGGAAARKTETSVPPA